MAGSDNNLDQPELAHKDLGQILAELEKSSDGQSLPPVDKWNPDFCGDMELVIKRDGSWHYQAHRLGANAWSNYFQPCLKRKMINIFW